MAIEHQDVACIVAGKFPMLDACFRPGPRLARARVYFRPEGAPNWYYVDASAPAPPKEGDAADLVCRRATLPKPKNSMIEKHVEYYVDATGRQQESSQTETFRPLVVKSEGDCKKKVIAPFVPSALVQVFPSLPAAFAVGGGLSGAAVAVVVGAGVAGGTGAVIVATGGGGNSGPTTTNPPVTTVAPATVPTTTATTTLPSSVPFDPVFKVFLGGVLQPDKITGTEPIQLRFFMCESTGPLPLRYNVLVNGSIVTAGCDSIITFNAGGFVPGFGAPGAGGSVQSAGTSYDVLMRIQSAGPGNNPQASRALTVDVAAVPPSTTTTTTTTTVPTTTTTTTLSPFCIPGDVIGPNVTLLGPPGGTIFHDLLGNYPVPFRATAIDPSGVLSVEYKIDVVSFIGGPPRPGGLFPIFTVSPGSPFPLQNPYDWPFAAVQTFLGPDCQANGFVVVKATDNCGNTTTTPSSGGVISVRETGCATSAPVPFLARPGDEVRLQAPDQRTATWVSQLDVPGGRGQIVLNGSEALFPAAGRVPLSARPRSGDNRVEAQLVQGQGRAGLWRFELAGDRTVAGSLRVIAGQVALVTGDVVVFRLKGQPGERVVFTFTGR